MTAPEADPRPGARDLSRYRPNAGIVLLNARGLSWIGRRNETEPGDWRWQWPQGGMDAGEDPEAAALRELYEETGARADQVEHLGRIEDWLCYDFPPEVLAKKPNRPWIGQKQAWFCYRFLGDDGDFDLRAVPPQEFDAFRWEALARVPALIIPWKRPVYEAVAAAFAPLADAAAKR